MKNINFKGKVTGEEAGKFMLKDQIAFYHNLIKNNEDIKKGELDPEEVPGLFTPSELKRMVDGIQDNFNGGIYNEYVKICKRIKILLLCHSMYYYKLEANCLKLVLFLNSLVSIEYSAREEELSNDGEFIFKNYPNRLKNILNDKEAMENIRGKIEELKEEIRDFFVRVAIFDLLADYTSVEELKELVTPFPYSFVENINISIEPVHACSLEGIQELIPLMDIEELKPTEEAMREAKEFVYRNGISVIIDHFEEQELNEILKAGSELAEVRG